MRRLESRSSPFAAARASTSCCTPGSAVESTRCTWAGLGTRTPAVGTMGFDSTGVVEHLLLGWCQACSAADCTASCCFQCG